MPNGITSEHDDYRLSEHDEDLATAAMRSEYARPRFGHLRSMDEQIVDLAVAGARALGCTHASLRDSETQWLRNEAGEIVYGISQ